MNTPNQTSSRRRGFTLLELLIVIAIIGLLVGMISAAVVKALAKGRITQNRADISGLGVSVEQFKQRFGDYPPSRLMLCENMNYYFVGGSQANGLIPGLPTDSVAFITKCFPNIDLAIWSGVNPPFGINWNGNKNPANGADLIAPNLFETSPFVILEGDQVLVFALGGIPSVSHVSYPQAPGVPPQCLGFSANPRNPADSTTDRIGPFYEFKSNRLIRSPLDDPNANTNPTARANRHYSYLDIYGTSDGLGNVGPQSWPYAYFSSYKVANGYNRYYNFNNLSGNQYPRIALSDCDGISPGGNLFPYADINYPQYRYLNPNSYQIISAGARTDLGFGPGSIPTYDLVTGQINGFMLLWSPTNAAAVYPDGSPGADDQANFAGSPLGAGN